MLSERLGTTLKETQAELDALKANLTDEKAKLKATLSATLAELDRQHSTKAKYFRALIRALKAEAVGSTEAQPEPPAA